MSEPRWHVLKWFGLSFACLVVDQVTKFIIIDRLSLYEHVPVFAHFNLVLTYNPGAAFSFLGDAGGWQRWLFIGIALIVSMIAIVWLLKLPSRGVPWLSTGLSLMLGGALGNLWDRVQLGQVVDFLSVYYGQWAWPAFNVADICICIGAACFIISIVKKEENM